MMLANRTVFAIVIALIMRVTDNNLRDALGGDNHSRQMIVAVVMFVMVLQQV